MSLKILFARFDSLFTHSDSIVDTIFEYSLPMPVRKPACSSILTLLADSSDLFLMRLHIVSKVS